MSPRYPVAKASVRADADAGRDADLSVDAWYPEGLGDFPVIVFVGGLGGTIPADVYTEMVEAVVAQGVIVVVPTNRLLLPVQFNERGEDIARLVPWLKGALPKALAAASPALPPRPDLSAGPLLLGHSAGSQAVVAASRRLIGKVRGVIHMDPVDGLNVDGMPHAIDKGETLKFAPPLLLLSAGLCKDKGWDTEWYPACCPPGVSAEHFYDYYTGKKWWVTALDYGHADLLDDAFGGIVAATRFCKAAPPSFDRPLYRDWLARWISTFALYGSRGLAGFPPELDASEATLHSTLQTPTPGQGG